MVITKSADQFIYAKLVNGEETLHLIVVYAAPSVSRRSGLWDQLKEVISEVDGPLVIGGDFNTIVRTDERVGENGRLSMDSVAFGEWIHDLSLIDMGFHGNKYTWKRGHCENNFVAKRLDRVMCCAHARLKWQEAKVTHLPFLASDHSPLYIQLIPVTRGNPRRRPFRFEAAWLKHDGFKQLVKTSWKGDISTPRALEKLRVILKKWNREIYGDVQKKKEELLREVKTVQDNLENVQTDALLAREEELLKELDEVLEQEEMIWFQKSREKYIALGDRNTSFFHTSTVIRRRRNRIEMLKDDGDNWICDGQELENLAIEYYKRLYSLADVDAVGGKLSQEGFTQLTREDQVELNKPFSQYGEWGGLKCRDRMASNQSSIKVAGTSWKGQWFDLFWNSSQWESCQMTPMTHYWCLSGR